MKAKVEIGFITILGLKVDGDMLKKAPNLVKTTEETMERFCVEMEKYFKKNKIITKIRFKVSK